MAGGGGVEEESRSGRGISDRGSSLFLTLFSYVFLFSLFLFSCFYVSSSISNDRGVVVDGSVASASGGGLGR